MPLAVFLSRPEQYHSALLWIEDINALSGIKKTMVDASPLLHQKHEDSSQVDLSFSSQTTNSDICHKQLFCFIHTIQDLASLFFILRRHRCPLCQGRQHQPGDALSTVSNLSSFSPPICDIPALAHSREHQELEYIKKRILCC